MKLAALAPVLEKIPFSLLLALYLADLGWDYYTFRYSDAGQMVQKQQEIQVAEEEIRKLETRVEQTRQFLKNLDGKKTEMRKIAQDLEGSRNILSETLDVPTLMAVVDTEARRAGMVVLALRPGEAKNQEFYTEQSFDLAFRGAYFQIIAFLGRVSSLQKIIRVDNFDFNAGQGANSRHTELTGTIQLKAYKYNTSKADETGAKSAEPKKGAGA